MTSTPNILPGLDQTVCSTESFKLDNTLTQPAMMFAFNMLFSEQSFYLASLGNELSMFFIEVYWYINL